MMTLPGAALASLARLDVCRVASSIALSVVLAVFVQAVARVAGLGYAGCLVLYLGIYCVIAAMLVRNVRITGIRTWLPELPSLRTAAIPVLTLSAVGIYFVWAGPYTEVPADAWWHIGEIKQAGLGIAEGELDAIHGVTGLFAKTAAYWYTLVAMILDFTGSRLEDSLTSIPLANNLLLCGGFYSFALFVFKDIVDNRDMRHLAAAASLLFFTAHFGINVFSFIRYYEYAPVSLNYLVYLSAVACLLAFLNRPGSSYIYLATTGLLFVAAAMIHRQEVVFIGIMCSAILIVGVAFFVFAAVYPEKSKRIKIPVMCNRHRLFVLSALAAVGYIALHVYTYVSMDRENPLAYRLLTDIHAYVPFLQNLYILEPTHQFFEVVTTWGLLVYLVFILKFKRLAPSYYLVAGMLIPFLTVFNPVFTDLYLRFSSPPTLWRMCYMIPLPLVGGFFMMKGLRHLVKPSNPWMFARGMAICAALVVLIFPIQSTFFTSPYSRIPTLLPVSDGNNYTQWNDLFEFLRGKDRSGIITDRVTGYLIDGLTKHHYRGYKFYHLYASHVERKNYDETEFGGNDGWKKLVKSGDFTPDLPWYVVINRRDGKLSETGRISGHWPADILKVSSLYSNEFITYVESHPDVFKKIWVQDRIAVYKVAST